MSSNTFWTLFFLLIVIIICELITLSWRFSPMLISAIYGSNQEIDEINQRIERLEEKLENIQHHSQAMLYSKTIVSASINDTGDLQDVANKTILVGLLRNVA